MGDRYFAKDNLLYHGREVQPGEELEGLTEEMKESLLQRNLVTVQKAEPPKPPPQKKAQSGKAHR